MTRSLSAPVGAQGVIERLVPTAAVGGHDAFVAQRLTDGQLVQKPASAYLGVRRRLPESDSGHDVNPVVALADGRRLVIQQREDVSGTDGGDTPAPSPPPGQPIARHQVIGPGRRREGQIVIG